MDKKLEIVITPHAMRRAQQSGIRDSKQALSLAAWFGTEESLNDNRVARVLCRRTLKELSITEGLPAKSLEPLEGIVVVTEDRLETRTVVTLLPRGQGGPRQFRQANKRYLLNRAKRRDRKVTAMAMAAA